MGVDCEGQMETYYAVMVSSSHTEAVNSFDEPLEGLGIIDSVVQDDRRLENKI